MREHAIQNYSKIDVLDLSNNNPYPFHQGGPFRVRHVSTWGQPTEAVDESWIYLQYQGRFVDSAFRDSTLGHLLEYPHQNTIDYYGARGFNRYKPDRAVQDLATMIGEFFDVRQMVDEFSTGLRKFVGSTLDREFGQGAAIRDILKLYDLQQRLDKRIRALRRNNGKPVRRKGIVTILRDSTTWDQPTGDVGVYPILPWGMFGPSPRNLTITTHETWKFAGRFVWYIPDLPVDGDRWPPQLLAQLLGAQPEVLWNLMPWSWLIDWFSNAGAVLSNIVSVASRGVMSDYAYIMCEYVDTWESRVNFMFAGRQMSTSSMWSRSYRTRDVMGPFGNLGVSSDQFTPEQGALLASVGITHMPTGKIIPGK